MLDNSTRISTIFISFRLLSALLFSGVLAMAAPPSRITRALDTSRTAVVAGRVHSRAQPQFDRGAVDPAKKLNYMMLLVKPSTAQQADLEKLLFDQQNPASASFRNWLTPEQFGNRFGLNSSDRSKVVAWLTSQGFAVDHLARSANWIAFSGTAAQVSNALHTPIHQFEVAGEMHFANTQVPSVPEALSEVVAGFLGLHDFLPVPNAKMGQPDYTAGSTHYLAPADFSTIYDLAPLYTAGIDGTGQTIAVVGQSDVLISDITKFRSTYGLPANNPKLLLYGTTDPGFNGAQFEGNLDIEWAGAVAPKATIYYVYGPDAFTAIIAAVEQNVAPVVSASYSVCEVDADPSYRAIAQQGNAQGITILAASGDAGAAACDSQGSEPFATRGRSVNFPVALPEVTGVGGTQFVEGSGTYWNTTNTTANGSATSYIPEAAWNESSTGGLVSTGGGASALYSKPVWQNGPGVPSDSMRDVPDVSLSAALHDGYLVVYNQGSYISGGTSCGTPSMAAILGLLNQYQVTNKFQKTAGLGNINPQLYRMAQSAPTAFHDVITGNNIVQCAQGSPDCLTGSFGYSAAAGYDLATGLGSVDANNLVTMWNTATNGSTVTLSANVTKATLNDTIQLTVTVAAATGTGTPTGTVNFNYETIRLGSATLTAGTATVPVPLYQIGFTGSATVSVEYSGDGSFNPGGATKTIQVTAPAGGVTSIVPSAPTTVWPQPAGAVGLSWQTTIFLSEVAGVPALVTGLTIDGVAQTLSQYFPAPQIEPKGTISANFVFQGLATPVIKTFLFTGTDPTGAVWTRQVAVNYASFPTYDYYNLNATPLTVLKNPANASCPWSVQLNLDDLGGYGVNVITDLQAGGVDYAGSIASIFGTRRLDAFGSLQGTMCFSNLMTPGIDFVAIQLGGGSFDTLTLSFDGPAANPGTLSAAPASLSLATPVAPAEDDFLSVKVTTATLAVNLSDKTQSWTASIYPANRTTSWLSASQLSGTGSGSITLTANPSGFEPGVYRANIVIQSQNSVPQYINVPVMFVYGGSSTGTAITAAANAASYQTQVSPGMLLSVFGTNLANSAATNSGNPLPYSLAGVSATVNGLAAPVIYASQGMLNIQVPYAAGAGPAVLGVNNNGQIAGFQFQISPASPGVFADANGNVVPQPVVTAGTALALYVTGTGDVNPAIKTAYAPSTGSTPPVPVLPLSVTVGGVPAFLEFVGITPGLIGVTQVNILVPSSTPLGNQPVVVTVGGASSAPVNIVVQPAS